MTCVDDNTVQAFVEGLLTSEEEAQVNEHLDSCADCRRTVSLTSLVASESGSSSVPIENWSDAPELADMVW